MTQGAAAGRSTAIVLFTDLVGSTELRSRVGENAAEQLRHVHDAVLAHAVEANRGRVVKNLGDGIMATFSGASDAVGAAVAIQQAIGRNNRSRAAALELRIGISAGDVVFEGDDCFGTPVIEAARLCGVAVGGQILASEMVRWLARSGEGSFTPIGNLPLKGLPEPVAAVQVDWELPSESSVPLPPFLTDMGRIFVGRDDELEGLSQLWKEATASELRVALLAGEPGVGKTRLAAELAGRVHGDGATVLAGRCDEDLGVPYQPFVEALRHFVDHAPLVASRLGRYGGELARLVPELIEKIPGLPAPLRSDPETERYRLFDAVAAWLTAASADEPLLLVLDDLQWAAKPTLLLLRHVVRASGGRVLILGTYRDTDLTHDHPLVELVADLLRQGRLERLSLSGLNDLAVRSFVEQAAGTTLQQDGLALARAIHRETEGNPFFVREVLRHLSETGAVEQRGSAWTTRIPVDQLGIPEGVREVVGRRLSRLSDDTNHALRIAAVVGPEFELGVVQTAGHLSEEALLGAVEEAAAARVVTEVSGTRYRFAHALVRATVYESLTAARKLTLHRKTAEAIEIVHRGAIDDHVPALAHHWARATAPAAETDKAVEYAARAGDQALVQLAHDEAVAYYRQALELLALAGTPDEVRRCGLLISLGEAQRRAGDSSYRSTLLEAARDASRRGDGAALARAALANSRGFLGSAAGQIDADRIAILELAVAAAPEESTRARVLANLAMELMYVHDVERRDRASQEALELARRVGEPATLAHVLTGRINAITIPHTLDERLALTAELVALAGRLGDPAVSSRAWFLRYRAALEAGDVAESDRAVEAFADLAATLGEPTLRWARGWIHTGRLLYAGRIAEADAEAHATFELGQASGQPDAAYVFNYAVFAVRYEQGRLGELEDVWRAMTVEYPGVSATAPTMALLFCEIGRKDKAQEVLDALVASDDFVPTDLTWSYAVARWAAVIAHLGDTRGAAVVRTWLAPYARQLVMPAGGNSLGAVAHYLGLLAATVGDHDDANDHFAAAAAIHERTGGPAWLARTRIEWARMLLSRSAPGDAERARELLGHALTTARELGLESVERRVVELLSAK